MWYLAPQACAPSPPPLVIKASLAVQPPPYEWLFRARTLPCPVYSGTDLRPPTLALTLYLMGFCEREVCPVIPERSLASSAASTWLCQALLREAVCTAAPSRSQAPSRRCPARGFWSCPVMFCFFAAPLRSRNLRITDWPGFEGAAQFCKFFSNFRVAEPSPRSDLTILSSSPERFLAPTLLPLLPDSQANHWSSLLPGWVVCMGSDRWLSKENT